MNTVLAVTLLVAVSNVSGQFGNIFGGGFGGESAFGNQFGVFNQEANDNSLNFGQFDAFANQAELDKAARSKAQIDAEQKAAARAREQARVNAGDSLAASKNAKGENFQQEADFQNLDTANNRKGFSKLGVQIVDEHAFNEADRLSANSANKLDFGERAFISEDIAAQTQVQAEESLAADALQGNRLSAADAAESQLSAAERVAAQKQARLDARDANQNRFGVQDSIFAEEGFGLGGGGLFGGFRRRR